MNPVRQALFARLWADTALTALLSTPTAIHHRVAPQSAAFPVVIFQRMTGTPEWAFNSAHIQWDVWLVKAVDRGSSGSRAEDIASRIDMILTDASLLVGGRTLLGIYRELDVDYEETTAGEVYHHVGSQFRIATVPA